MGQLHIEGPQTAGFLQGLLSNDLDRIEDGGAQYSLLTNEQGGIVDDLIAYRLNACRYLVVVNAGNTAAAYGWLKEREARGVEVTDVSDDYALLAVQGPVAIERLGLAEAPAFTHAMGEVGGVEVMICRTGYTGERGVELMCAAEDAGRALGRRRRASARRRAVSARATRFGSRSATRCTGTTSRRRRMRSRRGSAGSARWRRTSQARGAAAASRPTGRPASSPPS